jgi:membrane protein required for colicin V production
MTALDFAVLAILALSTLFAFIRGVVRELVAIASWIAGVIAALTLGEQVATMLPVLESSPLARQVLAFALVFVGVLVLGTLIAFVLSKLVHAVGLGFIDRLLGAVFGLVRGVVAVLLLVLVAGLTKLPQQDWWQNATLGPALVDAALSIRPWLPPAWAERLDYSGVPRTPARASSGGIAQRRT